MKILVFAGTTEGREIAIFLAKNGVSVIACVATEYGNMVMPEIEGIEVRIGRLESKQMEEVMRECELVIDATHPYAAIVTENIRAACSKMNTQYLRLSRPSVEAENVIVVADTKEAAEYLNTVDGNILLTTGSKELELFTAVKNFENRLYARVLPTVEVVEKCITLGFKGSRLICMQGPFSHELNSALLKQISAKYLVTKDTGSNGGFVEKISAANENGVTVILIDRPSKSEGLTLSQLKEHLAVRFSFDVIEKNSRFPMFIDLKGKKAVVVGGGLVATRRVTTLLKFEADILVVAHSFTPELKELSDKKIIKTRVGGYHISDLENAFLGIAATDDRSVNHTVYIDAVNLEIPVSVADCKEECSFYFPAVFEIDGVVGGLVSKNGNDHKLVRKVAEEIRNLSLK